MRLFNKSVAVVTALVGLFIGSSASFALIITAVGLDTTTQADWRTTTTVKPLDGDQDNVYGTLGYTAYATSVGTLSQFPSWLSATANGAVGVYGAAYPLIDNPTLTPGPSVADINSGIAYRQGVLSGTLYDLNFGLGTPGKTFRIGIFENAAMSSQKSYTLSSGASSATQLVNASENDTIVRYAFFDISGAAQGDVVTISGLIAPTGPTSNNGLSGITLDIVPEPASLSLLALGGALALPRRKSRLRA